MNGVSDWYKCLAIGTKSDEMTLPTRGCHDRGEESLLLGWAPGPKVIEWYPMIKILKQRTPTPRERELILLIRRGLQNKKIAYVLNISQSTVHAHIRNIMRKYGLHNRTQIAVMFTSHEKSFDLQSSSVHSEQKGPREAL